MLAPAAYPSNEGLVTTSASSLHYIGGELLSRPGYLACGYHP